MGYGVTTKIHIGITTDNGLQGIAQRVALILKDECAGSFAVVFITSNLKEKRDIK